MNPTTISPTTEAVLNVRDLSLEFPIYKGSVKALNGVSLRVDPGEIVGVVGESGSGKSVTAMAALRLLPPDGFTVTAGSLSLLGRDILAATEKEMRTVRGRDAAMIFQEPMTALNPTKRIGAQLVGVIQCHQPLSTEQATRKAIGLLRDMYISDPEQILRRYPFELSGGMRQRVMIALAFSCDPTLLIADEPTTALDVTVQRQVLLLLQEKARARGTAILFITHDMAVVSQFCDRVYVMYAGSVVEQGATRDVMARPRHPYTLGLLQGLPENARPGAVLPSIRGQVPNMAALPQGCAFRERCDYADDACLVRPALQDVVDAVGCKAACWHVLAREPIP